MSRANEALICDRPIEALGVASDFPASPIACVIAASISPGPSAEFHFSTAARQIAVSSMTADLVRGLPSLCAIAMTAQIIGSAAAVEGLIRCLRISSVVPISSDVLQNWVADWLAAMLWALVIGLAATWAHRLLSAKANRLIIEMDRLSLAMIDRIIDPTERPRIRPSLTALPTAGMRSPVTRPLRH